MSTAHLSGDGGDQEYLSLRTTHDCGFRTWPTPKRTVWRLQSIPVRLGTFSQNAPFSRLDDCDWPDGAKFRLPGIQTVDEVIRRRGGG